MKPLFSDADLVNLAQNCETILELVKVSEALKFLYEEHNANVNLHGFKLLTHLRIRTLINIPGQNKI